MKVKESLLKALAEANGEYISGTALAEKLGVSRNAVWKAVKALESEGYKIISSPSKGYTFDYDNNRLCEELILSKLETKELGRNLKIYKEVESTNTTAKELAAAGAVHGTAVITDTQTMGKGRLGRQFVSPAGTGMYMSVIIRPNLPIESVPLITPAVAVAAAEATEKLCGHEVQIKWVNDLYMNGKKICGILTEASLGLEMKSLDYAVIGIGINVLSVADFFSEELRQTATSVEDETGVKVDRNAICAAVLNSLEQRLEEIESRKYLSEYRRREYLTGKRITAVVDGKTITGSAVGIDNNANLMIEMPNGDIRYLNAGEANLCRLKR